MEILTHKNKAVARVPLTGPNLAILRRLTGIKWVNRDCHFPPTANNLRLVHESFPEAVWCEELHDRLSGLIHREEEARQMVLDKHLGHVQVECDTYQFGTKPRPRQLEAFMLSRDKAEFGLFMEVGTGKTKVILDTAAYLWGQGKLDMLLVWAVNGVHLQWMDECEKHFPSWVKWRAHYYRSGMGKRHKEELLEVANAPACLKVIAMNTEAMSLQGGLEYAERLVAGWRVMTVVDESHMIGAPGSKRTWNICRVGRQADYRRIMTGSDSDDGIDLLYSQFKYLNLDIIGVGTFAEFKSLYCIENQYGQVVNFRNVEDLQRRIEPYIFRAEKDASMPPETQTERPIDLTPEQRRLHQELAKEFYTEVKSHDASWVIESPLPITRFLRLRQICAGFVPGEAKGDWHPLDTERLAATVGAVEESRDKVVIWCCFQEEVTLVGRALEKARIQWARYDGAVSDNGRVAAKHRFIHESECRAFVSNVFAGGTGLDGLQQVSSLAVYHSHDWSRRIRVQTEGRLHRDGQLKPVEYLNLYAPRSVEMRVRKVQQDHKEVADLIKNRELLLAWIEEMIER